MINAQVRTESGEIVLRGICRLDWTATLQWIDANQFPLLSGMLPYADTVFNSRQAERLRREVSSQAVCDILGRDTVVEIERLCLRVENGSHLYLWFLGD